MVRLEFVESQKDKHGNLVATVHIVQKRDIAEPPYLEYVQILNVNDLLVTNGFTKRIADRSTHTSMLWYRQVCPVIRNSPYWSNMVQNQPTQK